MFEFVLTVMKVAFGTVAFVINAKFLKLWPPTDRPVVTVRQGKLRGVTATLPNGSRYHYFKGVPYAQHPVGELRFKPPVPLDAFSTPVLECLVDRSDCVHEDLFTKRVVGSEKGLYMNIYTPDFTVPVADEKGKFPVMVFIHGGGFLAGSGSSIVYNPIYLVQEGVIVIAMNYRLGPFGFLSLPEAGIAGNAGLKDQLLVLKWIKENIAQFGGDSGNVTLFGESAGSISAYLHYLSPNSRKYFHRVICQSGIPSSETFFQSSGSEKARKLAEIAGYTGDSDAEALQTLLRAPASVLVKNQHKVLTSEEKRMGVKFAFMPVIEDQHSEDSIITQTPEEIMKSFDTLDMPIIDGCNSGEGILSLYLMSSRIHLGNSEPERFVPQLLGSSEKLDRVEVGKHIRQFYFGDRPVSKDTCDQICDVMADNYFITNSLISAEWIAKYQPRVPHYHYRFTFDGRFSFAKRLFNQIQAKGACHGDDVFYIFSPVFLPTLQASSAECQVRNAFVKLWSNFAKFGDPTPNDSTAEDSERLGVKWNPIAKISKQSEEFNLDCLEIDTNPRMIRNPYPERIKLWRELLQRYRRGFL
ncbi:esterase B1-like [Wyeomyia smithii]|uniref:esterase B1-like n=1 Tax=Wyeomyia smithii TaxID=174621 RepID=UPI002467DB33|nr:esterase B1-like [Wyeomyia smithii]